jgi:rubrerythrin
MKNPLNHGQRDAQSWWSQVKTSEPLLRGWLLDQYRGEATAADRIEAFRERHAAPGSKAHRVLGVIASQERRHATWVGALLGARGLRPEVQDKAERYWPRTLPGLQDLATGCAIGAHAERMRLERIEVISRDPEAPADIRQTFARILREERFHERAFRALSTPEALERTRDAHQLGRLALGLAP